MTVINTLVNGVSASSISINDRGFNYGDGVFETIAYTKSEPVFWQQHLQRLSQGCELLGITCPKEDILVKDIDLLTESLNGHEDCVIKIVVTRGDSERGYRVPDNPVSRIVLTLSSYPSYPASYWENGVDITTCKTTLSSQERLAGIKHLNRLEQVLARQEWDNEYQEGLMLNISGHVVEAVMSNVFVIENSQIITPRIDCEGVKGVMRDVVLKLCESNGIMTMEDNLTLERVLFADEVFLTNSLIGVWPVKSINKTIMPVGSVTRKIRQDLINKYEVDYASLAL